MKSFSNSENLKDVLFFKEIPKDEKAKCKFCGRTEEFLKMICIMSKRQNRNILIWGDFGIGKSSLVYQLIWTLSSDNCPNEFVDYIFISLDIPALVTKSKANIHNALSELCSMLEKNPKLCLIIENFEFLIIGIETEIKLELRKLLSIPGTCIIATADGINEQIIRNNSIYNLFEKIHLEEPVIDDIYFMIKNQISEIESYHNVTISRHIAKWLIYCSEIFSDYRMPKRCVDLIDEVAAYAKLNMDKKVTKKHFFNLHTLELQKYVNLSDEHKRNVAIHELGHFIVHYFSKNLSLRPFLVSIVPIGLCDGSTYLYELPNFVETVNEDYYVQYIGCALGGKVSEEIFGVPANSGSSADLDEANEQARNFSSMSGMNPSLNDKIVFEDEMDSVDDDTMDDITSHTAYILGEARIYAESIIHKNQAIIKKIIPELIKNNGILTSYEIEKIMKRVDKT